MSGPITTVADIVRVHASERPDNIAIISGDQRVTYGQLDARSSRAAIALNADGVNAHDRVAVLDKNTPVFFDLVFAAAKLNAVLCPVNWRLAPMEAAYIINDSGSKVLVVGEEMLPLLEAMR